MTNDMTAPVPQRREDRLVAGAIATLGALMLVAILHHPVARHVDPAAKVASMARLRSADENVHAMLIMALTVVTSLMAGVAARLGLRRPHVLFGLVASGLALGLMCVAMVLDGFVAPAIAQDCVRTGGACAAEILRSTRYGAFEIEYLTRIGLVALAASTLAWGADLLLRRDRAMGAGLVGVVVAVTQLSLLLTDGARLNPHSLAVIMAAQVAWYLGVALMIARGKGPYRPAQG